MRNQKILFLAGFKSRQLFLSPLYLNEMNRKIILINIFTFDRMKPLRTMYISLDRPEIYSFNHTTRCVQCETIVFKY